MSANNWTTRTSIGSLLARLVKTNTLLRISHSLVIQALALYEEQVREEEAQNYVRRLVVGIDSRTKELRAQNESILQAIEALEKKLVPSEEAAQ